MEGKIYNMYETLCTVADMGVSGHPGREGVYTYMHGNENLSMLYSKGGTDEDRIIQSRLC